MGDRGHLREVAVDARLDVRGQVGGKLDMKVADLQGGPLESIGHSSQGLREEEPWGGGEGAIFGGGGRPGVEEGQGRGEGLGAPGEIEQAREGEGLGQVLTIALGLHNGHAEVLAITYREVHLGGLRNGRVQPLRAGHKEKVGKLETTAGAPVLGLTEALSHLLTYAEADGVVADARLQGEDAGAVVRMASDGRQLTGSAIEAAVEGLHKGEFGGDNRGRGGGRERRGGGLQLSQVAADLGEEALSGGRLPAESSNFHHQDLEGILRLLGLVGIQPPGAGGGGRAGGGNTT
jgi:hypothetical protein